MRNGTEEAAAGGAPPGASENGNTRLIQGVSRKARGRGAVGDAIVGIVSAEFRLPVAHILSPTRGSARAARARQVAMYLAHVAGELSLTDVGIVFGRDRTTVAHACGIVEDARDRVIYDRRIDRLERRVAESLSPVGQAA